MVVETGTVSSGMITLIGRWSRSIAISAVFAFLCGASAGALAAGRKLSLQDGLANPYPAPKFSGIAAWLNSPPLTMQELKGKVVLIDFWTYSCINCVRTLPYLSAWYRKYHSKGLIIVGVHSPEFNFEKRISNVKAAVTRYRISYPVAMDNQMATWNNYNNLYWPAHYLINRQGMVVYTHFGEGEYATTENNIRFLLGMTGPVPNTAVEAAGYMANMTPETYLGYGRAERYAGTESIKPDAASTYHSPAGLPADGWALNGKWTVTSEKIVADARGAAIRLNFNARRVFMVLGTASGKPIKVKVELNGLPVGNSAGGDVREGVVEVKRNTLYRLIDQTVPKNGVIEIETEAPGLEAYTFTFG